MTKEIRTRVIIGFLALILGVCAVFLATLSPTMASAETKTYSDVLSDLKRDASFQVTNYPDNPTDYSLSIIQLAESEDRELFVYVYQPSQKTKALTACSINISTTINDAISFTNYKLELLNSSGVLCKYKVKDFTVRDEPVRYYVITSIYRPFDSSIDQGTGNSNTITEVNYAVNKQYCFGTINGKPYCSMVDIETIVITDKFVGFVRYPDGFRLYVGACDAHFVAFNTDKPMDKLLEADVYYTKQKYETSTAAFVGKTENFGTKEDQYAYLKYTDKVEHNGGGWFAGTYKWDRIQTVSDFIRQENRENIYHGAILDVKTSSKLTDAALRELQGKQWVLRFAETSYELGSASGVTWSFSSIVGDVTILRLKFETDGVTYNLGVIDNKQTGSTEPVNEVEYEISVSNRAKKWLLLLMLIILLIILAPILPYILKFVFWIVALPFKIIGGIWKLFRKIGEKRAEKQKDPPQRDPTG